MTDWERISKRDLDRLSAYLDHELSPSETSRLEARLQHDDVLRQALQELRATVEVVGTLPGVEPPRDFRLTAAMVEKAPAGPLAGIRMYPALQLSTALAALALVALVGFDVVVNQSLVGYRLDRPAAEPLAVERAAEVAGGASAPSQLERPVEQQEPAQLEAETEAMAEDSLAQPPAEEAAAAAAEEQPQEPAADRAAAEEQPQEPAADRAAAGEDLEGADETEGDRALEVGEGAQALEADGVQFFAEPAFEPTRPQPTAGRIALTLAEIGLGVATMLLFIFTLRERRRA